MSPPLADRRVYHVGPWRRAVPWLIFGPFLLLAVGILIFSDDAEDRAFGILLFAILSVLILGMHVLISWARLELSAEGVRLRQIGMNLNAPWSNVAGLRLERGRQGIVTKEAITARGAANLAAVRGFGLYAAPMYDEEQRAAMAERRWIPIEAFAWHLKHGHLRDDFAHFAADVQPLPSLIERPVVSPAERRRELLNLAAILTAVFTGIVVLVLGPPTWAERVFAVLFALVAPLLTLRAVLSTRNAFRTGARFMGVMFILLALMGVLWCVVAWDDLVVAFSGPD